MNSKLTTQNIELLTTAPPEPRQQTTEILSLLSEPLRASSVPATRRVWRHILIAVALTLALRVPYYHGRMFPLNDGGMFAQIMDEIRASHFALPTHTAYNFLDIPLSYRNIKSSQRTAMVCDTLDRFHIVAKRDLFPSQLSGGQQQLVAVARAVIAGPKLILADEPTGNLHSTQGKEIMELFKKLNEEGATIVQVTHSEANAAYGHRVVQLADGWMVP